MFAEKQYRGKNSKYPTVTSSVSDEDKLAIFVTTWGDTSVSTSIINNIKDYYLSARTDKEVTSPFPLSKDLSLAANHLRIALMLANDKLYNEYNKDEYTAIAEVMIVSIQDRELNIAYAGGPSFLCQYAGQEIIALHNSNHLSHQFVQSRNYPLPKDYIGAEMKKNVKTESFRHTNKNTYYFILADALPPIGKDDNIKTLETKLKLNSEKPFWLATWSI